MSRNSGHVPHDDSVRRSLMRPLKPKTIYSQQPENTVKVPSKSNDKTIIWYSTRKNGGQKTSKWWSKSSESNCQPGHLYSVKTLFENENEIKIFSDKMKGQISLPANWHRKKYLQKLWELRKPYQVGKWKHKKWGCLCERPLKAFVTTWSYLLDHEALATLHWTQAAWQPPGPIDSQEQLNSL